MEFIKDKKAGSQIKSTGLAVPLGSKLEGATAKEQQKTVFLKDGKPSLE